MGAPGVGWGAEGNVKPMPIRQGVPAQITTDDSFCLEDGRGSSLMNCVIDL